MLNLLSGWMLCGGGGQITLVYQTYFTTVHNDIGRLIGYINAEGSLAMTLLRFYMIGSR